MLLPTDVNFVQVVRLPVHDDLTCLKYALSDLNPGSWQAMEEQILLRLEEMRTGLVANDIRLIRHCSALPSRCDVTNGLPDLGKSLTLLSFCRAYHSQLADVQTREENTFLVDTIDKIDRDTGTVHDYWLDGTDQVLEGVWVWASTGKQLSYTNWYPNEPNSAHGNEDCLEIKNHKLTNGWNDINCSYEFNFICEME
ncbi:unnamed protein product [Mytilus edulis]|uniref:C-type lectin domain-containing protein n=1 Tax=Mytilus edulis TaxID=6550 RepID=A0A8S3U599_MYTED|nr:unnamed protein product [Mytilus edulis]